MSAQGRYVDFFLLEALRRARCRGACKQCAAAVHLECIDCPHCAIKLADALLSAWRRDDHSKVLGMTGSALPPITEVVDLVLDLVSESRCKGECEICRTSPGGIDCLDCHLCAPQLGEAIARRLAFHRQHARPKKGARKPPTNIFAAFCITR